MTMTLVGTVTVGAGGASTIEFAGIPQSATDLLLLVSARNTATNKAGWFRINSSSATNYNYSALRGDGSSVVAFFAMSEAQGYSIRTNGSDLTANTFASTRVYFHNYAGNTVKKYSIDGVDEGNVSTTYQEMINGYWNQTAAITSLLLGNYGGSFAQNTVASLYTITRA